MSIISRLLGREKAAGNGNGQGNCDETAVSPLQATAPRRDHGEADELPLIRFTEAARLGVRRKGFIRRITVVLRAA